MYGLLELLCDNSSHRIVRHAAKLIAQAPQHDRRVIAYIQHTSNSTIQSPSDIYIRPCESHCNEGIGCVFTVTEHHVLSVLQEYRAANCMSTPTSSIYSMSEIFTI